MSRARTFSLIFLWRQADWGLYRRRNEALLWEIAQRDCVSRVLHLEPVSLPKLFSIANRWRTASRHSIRESYAFQLMKVFSIHPVLVDQDRKVWAKGVFTFSSRQTATARSFRSFLLCQQARDINREFRQPKDTTVLVAYPPAPYLEEIVERLDHDVLVADVVDDVPARRSGEQREQALRSYQSILPRCSLVFSTCPSIAEKYRAVAQETFVFLPNAVDSTPFRQLPRPTGKPQKAAGYVGSLNHTLDVELLDQVIVSFPDVEFVLVGFADSERRALLNRMTKRYANLRLLGPRHFSEVPDILARFDVLMSLKKADRTTVGNDSMKIYQYLATGRPIVTLPVSPAERFEDLLYVATDATEFVEQLSQALGEDSPRLQTARVEAARKESWAARADEFLQRIKQHLETSQGSYDGT